MRANLIMLNFMLYAAAAIIWGSTWLGIKLQLTQVPPILSVGYRFCLAALILAVYCMLRNKRLSFSRRDHLFMAIQGFSLFGLSYCMSYLATSYLTSGLVAVVFSTILMWNILNLKLFMGQAIAWRAFWGGILGLSGICTIFWHDLSAFAATRGLIGLIMALAGAYLASVGNVVGAHNARTGVPVTQANLYGMAYGGLLTLAIHFAGGGAFVMDWSMGGLPGTDAVPDRIRLGGGLWVLHAADRTDRCGIRRLCHPSDAGYRFAPFNNFRRFLLDPQYGARGRHCSYRQPVYFNAG